MSKREVLLIAMHGLRVLFFVFMGQMIIIKMLSIFCSEVYVINLALIHMIKLKMFTSKLSIL